MLGFSSYVTALLRVFLLMLLLAMVDLKVHEISFMKQIVIRSKKGLALDQASSTKTASRKPTYIVGSRGASQLGGIF